MTRIMIVDDHPIVRDALSTLMSQRAGAEFEIVGMAGDANSALSQIKMSNPDMIIVDISLEGLDGIELIKTIRALEYKVKILVLSMYDESLYAERVLEAGADGYIMKQREPCEIFTAIRTVAHGDIFFSNRILRNVVKQNVGVSDRFVSSIHSLSDRELETFRLLGLGWKTNRIADELHISIKTVETYCGHIKTKLHLENFNQLIAHAAHCVSSNPLEPMNADQRPG